MGRIFGIVVIVLAIWVGLEIYQNGTGGAFGGLFARTGVAEESTGERQSTGQQAGSAVQQAHQDADDRREKMLEE